MTSYHNPALVSDAQVGQHHRLLSTEDLSKPLPEGASFWWPESQSWVTTNALASRALTYRIPLTPVDRLRQEIAKRLENEGWSEADIQDLKEWFDSKQPLPPAPSSIPWTLETHPDVACVKHKQHESITERLITRWSEHGGYLDGFGWVNYSELHSDWLQRSGDPAGQEVTV